MKLASAALTGMAIAIAPAAAKGMLPRDICREVGVSGPCLPPEVTPDLTPLDLGTTSALPATPGTPGVENAPGGLVPPVGTVPYLRQEAPRARDNRQAPAPLDLTPLEIR